MESSTIQAFSETYDIISHMEGQLKNRIPQGFINLLKNNRDLRI